jgi:hypothetical protein
MLDLNKAIEFAQLVDVAYDIPPTNLANSAGKAITAGGNAYTVVTTIYAFDLATDINPGRGINPVSIGLVCQADVTGDAVIAIRGTEGIYEWITDGEFLMVKCPFLAGAGQTEDGFTSMYESLRTGAAALSARVVNALETLPFKSAPAALTICGHSLGGALATLLAVDIAVNTRFKQPTVYTYGSPRTGDPLFASTYDQVVKSTFRIANRMDLVPKLPLPPFYEHVLELSDLNPIQLLPLPPRLRVKPTIVCQHIMHTYLHLMSVASGGPVLPLDQSCIP